MIDFKIIIHKNYKFIKLKILQTLKTLNNKTVC